MQAVLGNFNKRLIVFFAALICAAQIVLVVLTLTSSKRELLRSADVELATGTQVFSALMGFRSEQLLSAVKALVGDHAFREALSTGDEATIQSALENHSERIKADLAILLDTDGNTRVVSGLSIEEAAGDRGVWEGIMLTARRAGTAAAIGAVGESAVHIVMVPVMAPRLTGWVAMGFRIGDELAQSFARLTGLDVSYVLDDRGAPGRIASSTLVGSAREQLGELGAGLLAGGATSDTLLLDEEPYLIRVAPILSGRNAAAGVLLKRSYADILQPYRKLRSALLWITAAVLGGCLGGVVLITRRVTRPLTDLTHAARDLARLMEKHPGRILDNDDELGQLTALFHGIAHKAQHDSLTGLPNRALVVARLTQSIARSARNAQPVTVMFMDLDGFKAVNDLHGHELGDQVLRKTAQRLASAVRKVDTVARLGGDEFLIVLENVDASQAQMLGRHYAELVSQPIASDSGPLVVGLSIGIAQYPDNGVTARELLGAADAAMYAAKRQRQGPVIAGTAEMEQVSVPEDSQLTLAQEIYLDTWEGTERSMRRLQTPGSSGR